MSKYKGSNKIISFMSLAFAPLVKFQSERLGKLKARIEAAVRRGIPVASRKLRRSRCWRGYNMGHGRPVGHPKTQERRAAKYYANAVRMLTPQTLAVWAKAAQEKANHVWQDPSLQSPNRALAMAA